MLTGGDDAPGMNSAIRAVALSFPGTRPVLGDEAARRPGERSRRQGRQKSIDARERRFEADDERRPHDMDRQESTPARTNGAPENYRRILVGTDGSGCSARAAAHAVYLARELGARLYVLYSVNVERAFHAGIHFGEAVGELERTGGEATAAVRTMAEAAGVGCEEILTTGRPHRAIIGASEEVDADLIVVGSTGMTSLERALIGSESEALMRLSKRPVLIVHEA